MELSLNPLQKQIQLKTKPTMIQSYNKTQKPTENFLKMNDGKSN